MTRFLRTLENYIASRAKRDLLEAAILFLSFSAICLAFFLQEEKSALSLVSSLCGIAGIFCVAKGLIVGQYVCLVYAVLYIILSFQNAYFGECLIAVFTMLPSSLLSIVEWVKHPAKEQGKVQVNKIGWKECCGMGVVAVLLTVGAYYLLAAFQTAELEVSTLSVLTSLGASYLLIRRSKYYALFYIVNDLVLIALWSLALTKGEAVLPSVISYGAFLLNDGYGLYNWHKREKQQEKEERELQTKEVAE